MVELCQIAKNAYGGLRTNIYGQGGIVTNKNAYGGIEPTKIAYGGLRINICWQGGIVTSKNADGGIEPTKIYPFFINWEFFFGVKSEP